MYGETSLMSSKKLVQRKRMFEANQHRLQVVEESEPAPMADAHEERLQGSREVKTRLEADLQAEHEREENAAGCRSCCRWPG